MAIYHGRKRINKSPNKKQIQGLLWNHLYFLQKLCFFFFVFVGPHGRPLFSSKQIILDSQATLCYLCLPFWLRLTSHQKALPMDSLWRLYQASVHQAKSFEDSGRVCSVHEPHGCKHPLFCPIFGSSIVVPPAHPIQHIWVWHLHHPQGENPLAPHGPSQERFWNHLYSDKTSISMMECCIVDQN